MPTCIWVLTVHKTTPVYITGCENIHFYSFHGGNPKGYSFCPYCGHKLELQQED